MLSLSFAGGGLPSSKSNANSLRVCPPILPAAAHIRYGSPSGPGADRGAAQAALTYSSMPGGAKSRPDHFVPHCRQYSLAPSPLVSGALKIGPQ